MRYVNTCTLSLVILILSLVFLKISSGSAQSDFEPPAQQAAPATDDARPRSDFDGVRLAPGQFGEYGRVYRESNAGTLLYFFNINSQKATGWAIDTLTGRGWDIYGRLNGDWSFRWSSQGAPRCGAGGDSNFWTAYPYRDYSYVNQFGESGRGILSLPSHSHGGCFYESFFDNSADNWITNETSKWSIVKVSDREGCVYNRVYNYTNSADPDASVSWAAPVSVFDYTMSSSIGFTFCADLRRLDGKQTSIGLVFCADNTNVDNGYVFLIGSDGYSLRKTVDRSAVTLLGPVSCPEICTQRAQWNSLKVEMQSNVLRLFVNGTLVATYSDPQAIPEGMVGVTGTSTTSAATLQWDNITCHRKTSF